jgi:hypothetical protein
MCNHPRSACLFPKHSPWNVKHSSHCLIYGWNTLPKLFFVKPFINFPSMALICVTVNGDLCLILKIVECYKVPGLSCYNFCLFIGCILSCVSDYLYIYIRGTVTQQIYSDVLQLDLLFSATCFRHKRPSSGSWYKNTFSHWTTEMDPYQCNISYYIIITENLPQVSKYYN